jgi:hypothetical protein
MKLRLNTLNAIAARWPKTYSRRKNELKIEDLTTKRQRDYNKNMKIIRQRESYLENLKRTTRKFWVKVVADYNAGIPVPEIASKYTNPKTNRPYSRQHIHAILKKMSEIA